MTETTPALLARLRSRDPAPRRVSVSRDVDLDAATTFRILADVRNHSRWIPLTRAVLPSAPEGPLPVGARFTMVSGPAMPDRMVVTELTELSMTLRKAGPVLLGTAGITVQPLGEHRSRAIWWEDAYLAGPLPARVTRAVVGPVLAAMMRLALARFAREVAARPPG
ncbi:SRPBCC family protein [Sanguibacter suarezii]|uniref:SRPBCC family protein n=1 Tax=Sanguibacter suarezii TaxID=60921 RepID=UPI00082EB104|nr:SRPBCC family protein [Sanguibacter suarezii]